MTERTILLLGVGMVALAVYDSVRGHARVIGTTRDPMRLFDFVNTGIEPVVMPWPSREVIEPLANGADVLVSFPPDGATDKLLAPACAGARTVVYISSTGVYGSRHGAIDDHTPVANDEEAAAPRLAAEREWQMVGATILRAPAIYGPTSGLHIRLREGNFAIPGDGTGVVSRIHVDDLAHIISAVFHQQRRGETFVVGDLCPATHQEVVGWLCEELQMPMPPRTPLEEVSAQLKSSRSVDPHRALKELGVTLKYPTYKEGFKALIGQFQSQ